MGYSFEENQIFVMNGKKNVIFLYFWRQLTISNHFLSTFDDEVKRSGQNFKL